MIFIIASKTKKKPGNKIKLVLLLQNLTFSTSKYNVKLDILNILTLPWSWVKAVCQVVLVKETKYHVLTTIDKFSLVQNQHLLTYKTMSQQIILSNGDVFLKTWEGIYRTLNGIAS